LLKADSVLTLATGAPVNTAVLNYGQGASVKFTNLSACFYN
jgi:hypothetical protein